eukprot:4069601-Amphidinium_carterae.1
MPCDVSTLFACTDFKLKEFCRRQAFFTNIFSCHGCCAKLRSCEAFVTHEWSRALDDSTLSAATPGNRRTAVRLDTYNLILQSGSLSLETLLGRTRPTSVPEAAMQYR